ncbi:esterase LipW [Bisporella sp. PMI_857]|nr:esterase LipW [Bisporella sp. PMI_857]
MPPLKPPYDPELVHILNAIPPMPLFTNEVVKQQRAGLAVISTPEVTLVDPAIVHEEVSIPGPGGKISLSILRTKTSASSPRPLIFYIHSGGMILGSKLLMIGGTFEWIKELDAVLISVEYRLAPEHPFPAGLEDCYTAFKWAGDHAGELGIDTGKLIVAGHSAGGGLAAGLSMMVRDRGGPRILAQCLNCPMLDDRVMDASSQQYVDEGIWTGANNKVAWNWYLNGKRGSKDVSPYAAPARATDLTGLPTAWVDVGSAECFRDEDVAYAGKLSEAGVGVELHVWPGAFHCFDLMAPDAVLSKSARTTRLAWFKRVLAQAPISAGASKL